MTFGAAVTAADAARRRQPGIQLNVYRCRGCGTFHMGHVPAQVQRAMEERRGEC